MTADCTNSQTGTIASRAAKSSLADTQITCATTLGEGILT